MDEFRFRDTEELKGCWSFLQEQDGAALVKQFTHTRIEGDDVWSLIEKTDVRKVAEYDQKPRTPYITQMTIVFTDGSQQRQMVKHRQVEQAIR